MSQWTQNFKQIIDANTEFSTKKNHELIQMMIQMWNVLYFILSQYSPHIIFHIIQEHNTIFLFISSLPSYSSSSPPSLFIFSYCSFPCSEAQCHHRSRLVSGVLGWQPYTISLLFDFGLVYTEDWIYLKFLFLCLYTGSTGKCIFRITRKRVRWVKERITLYAIWW